MNDMKKVLIVAISVVLVIAIAAGVSIGVMANTMNGLKDKVAELDQAYASDMAAMKAEIEAAKAANENLVTAADFEAKLAAALGEQNQTMQSLISTAVKNQIEELGTEGLTEAQVQAIIDAAVENCLTEADIDTIIADVDAGLTKDEVKKIVADYTAGTLTYGQIMNLIEDESYSLRKFLEDQFTEELNKVIAEVNKLGGKLDDVEGSLDDFKDTISYTVDDTNNVVEISTEKAFVDFAKSVNEEGKTWTGYTVKLTNNMNLKNIDWTPIGTNADDAKKFKGVFDGQNYTISNLTVDQKAGYHAAGLFGALNGTVKNLTIKNATINSISSGSPTDNGTAVVAGSIYTTGLIENVTVINATVTGNRYVAGIAGYVYGSIKNCVVTDSTITAAADDLTGSWDNGDKVGGIAGAFFSEGVYVLSGNTVTGTTVKGYRDVGGIAGFSNGVVVGSVVNDNKIVQDLTHNYKDETPTTLGKIVGRDKVTKTNAESASDLDAASAGDYVALPDDMTISSNDTTANSGYGATGVTVTNGATLDGDGNILTVNNANGTWDCAINPQNGVIKNITVNGAFRGIFMSGASGDVYIDNVVLDKVCYTFNSDAGNKDYGVYISNSTLNGWTSYSNVHKEVVFTNCNFGQGTGDYQYAFCRPYNASVFENCVFEEGFKFDTSETSDLVFINCYYGDTLITAENAATLAKGETVFFYKGLNSITIK